MTVRDAGDFRPSLTKREREDYERFIMDCPIQDLDWLIGMLLYHRAKWKRDLTHVEFKICDKCMLTFPKYTLMCDKCGSDRLRGFITPFNHNEILDDVRKG